jgi:hypothetical protein
MSRRASRANCERMRQTPYDSEEELYFVHSGRARFELDGEQVDAPAGTFVFVPPAVKRTAFAEVAGRGREVIEMSGCSEPLYNLACCESLAGRPSEAIEHLRLALERSNQYRERLGSLAAEDSDFDPIRDEPGFKELVR